MAKSAFGELIKNFGNLVIIIIEREEIGTAIVVKWRIRRIIIRKLNSLQEVTTTTAKRWKIILIIIVKCM